MTTNDEIYVVTSSGSGHLFPCLELCKRISSRNYKTTLVLPSNLSSSVPSSFLHHHPFLSTAEIGPSSGGPPMLESDPGKQQIGVDLEAHLSRGSTGPDSARAHCAIVDFQMGWTKHIFWKFNIPVISFFTFGACAAAMEWGTWKGDAGKIHAGEVLTIPGLPEEMSVTNSDLKRRPSGPQRAGQRGGPPKPGDQPPWVPLIDGSVGLMFNTCDDLERPFINYLTNHMGMPVWGVGPLLPEQYWQPSDSMISDRHIRQQKHHGNYSEDEVTQWLDSKPRGSVIYVAFGSEVGPTMEEYPELAGVLEDSTRPFIWVIQGGADGLPALYGSGFEVKVGNKGLVIRGWAPQLLILSHPSTGGFLSHCGWNSTAEAVARGVPLLAWPIRGDQIYNAKLVVKHLKVGYFVSGGEWSSGMVKKENVLDGIEKVMNDGDLHKREAVLRAKFSGGFPASSEIALDGFADFIRRVKF